jgi:hypothetical protein
LSDRSELIEKLVLNLHVSVAERQLLGVVHEGEIAEVIRAILDQQGSFPRPRRGAAIYEGAVITTDTGHPEITWERSHPINPTVLAEERQQSFNDLESAIRAYIDSEWPQGIDGIAIKRVR